MEKQQRKRETERKVELNEERWKLYEDLKLIKFEKLSLKVYI